MELLDSKGNKLEGTTVDLTPAGELRANIEISIMEGIARVIHSPDLKDKTHNEILEMIEVIIKDVLDNIMTLVQKAKENL